MRPFSRSEPRSAISFALALGVHALMIAVLFFAISWKTRPPAPVVAELWTPPELPARPAPQVEPPKPAPPPKPKPEPKIEPTPAPKPDIALEREKEIKRLEELERKRREDERKRREEEARRLEAEKKRKEEEARARAEREKQRIAEEQRLKDDLERARDQRLRDQLARELGATPPAARAGVPVPGDPRATDEYRARIAAKIRGNVVLPPDFVGNPEAEFEVQQLPSGDILSVKLAKSSGSRALDDAWERAILKSSPLPQPAKREVFQANLRLKFRPIEER